MEPDVLRRAGDASVLILTSLADGPKHGYALIQDIKGFAGVELGPGTLYGALDRLERFLTAGHGDNVLDPLGLQKLANDGGLGA